MEYTDIKKVRAFFKSHPDFLEPSERINPISIEVGDYVYISCYIKTKSETEYYVVYEPTGIGATPIDTSQFGPNIPKLLKSKEEALREDDYWSPFNKGFYGISNGRDNWVTYCDDEKDANVIHEGTGAVLVVLNESNMNILKVYYFKDTYNIDFLSEFVDVVEDKIIVCYSDYNYVFQKDEYTYLTFVHSYKYLKLNYIWISYPYHGYDASCGWHLINFRDNIEHPIYALTKMIEDYPSINDYKECVYDFDKRLFVFSTETESVRMDIRVINAKENDLRLLYYSDIGTSKGNIFFKHDTKESNMEIEELMQKASKMEEEIKSLRNQTEEVYSSYLDLSNQIGLMCDKYKESHPKDIRVEKEDKQKEDEDDSEISFLYAWIGSKYSKLKKWNCGIPGYYFFVYTPIDVSCVGYLEYENARRLIWGFKDGRVSADGIVSLKLNSILEYGRQKFTLVCIPASTREKTERRYKFFMNRVCEQTGMANGYNYVRITKEGPATHIEGGDGCEYECDKDFFKGRRVVIFDDVYTRGRHLDKMKDKLEAAGANVWAAFFLGLTCRDFRENPWLYDEDNPDKELVNKFNQEILFDTDGH